MTTYYPLGRSGLRVSRLSLGTMTFGVEWGWGCDEATSRQLFDLYRDTGGNFFDTADGYTGGTSETWLGQFIADAKMRDKAVIATKYTFNGEPGNPNAGGNGRKNMHRALEGSLKRLKTDYVDLYIMHAWDQVTHPEEVLRTFDDLVRAGKVRYTGLSNVPAWYAGRIQTLAEQTHAEPFCNLQLEYSLVQRDIEDEFTTAAQHLGMGITVWSPLASGLLSGKYKHADRDKQVGGRLDKTKGSGNPGFEKFSDRNWEILAVVEQVAKQIGKPVAQVAINWVANRPGVASVILGATKTTQLADNLASLDLTIPPELVQKLNDASAPLVRYPYYFYGQHLQSMVHGGVGVGYKRAGYFAPVEIKPK